MRYAVIFPGQGAQSVAMMAGFAESSVVQETFATAKAVLGMDFWGLQAEGPAEALARTTVTQPLLLTAGVAVYRHWQSLGAPLPSVAAGHSLGEYCALVAAEALSFETALDIVSKRAALMEGAAEHGVGAMAAILNAEVATIEACCRDASNENETVEPVNFNTPEQVVIAGHRPAVNRACELLRAKGVKRAILLPVGGAFHSRLMVPASKGMRQVLANVDIRPPKFPLIHNADLQSHPNPDDIREALAAQVSAPVRWVDTIGKLAALGMNTLVEAAPGKVLAGLNRRINPDMVVHTFTDIAAMINAKTALEAQPQNELRHEGALLP